MFESSKEEFEGSCVDAREKLTNSIRLKWRKLKSHMERLDSQGSGPRGRHVTGEVVPYCKGNLNLRFLKPNGLIVNHNTDVHIATGSNIRHS